MAAVARQEHRRLLESLSRRTGRVAGGMKAEGLGLEALASRRRRAAQVKVKEAFWTGLSRVETKIKRKPPPSAGYFEREKRK